MTSAADFTLLPGEISPELHNELGVEEGNKNVRYRRFHVKETQNYLDFLRPKVKDISQFWLIVLMSHQTIAPHLSSKLDQHALSFLEDIELKQDVNDFRPYELVFHFKENPYFTNKTLSKKYSLQSGLTPVTDDSVTEDLRKFEGDEQLEAGTTTIDWKSDEVNLCAKMPRGNQVQGGEADDLDGFEGDPGSFFLFFQEKGDLFKADFKDDILPDAFAYFEGRGDNGFGDDSEDDELDEEDDDDEEEIDLENEIPKKKRKVGGK
nr:template-activating factor I [Cryptococcus depauperatus CBS 7841]ODO02457.1 template-activating factor I [Cryptococcus depauperatus CBS 7855]